jgi:hypothetical protein
MGKVRKPFCHIDEALLRWDMTDRDLAAFVLADQLTLSATVAGLEILIGKVEDLGDGERTRLPARFRRVVGTIELEPDDAWRILREGQLEIFAPRAAPDTHVEICDPSGGGAGHLVNREDLVICSAELDRFEREHGITQKDLVPAYRGAPPRFDWDSFWIEACRLLYEEGVPRTQGEFVRHMATWFEANAKSSPDESTIKKKLKPLWHAIRPADEPVSQHRSESAVLASSRSA